MVRCCARRRDERERAVSSLYGSARKSAQSTSKRRSPITRTSMCSSSSQRDRFSQERIGSREVKARINAYLFQEFDIEGDETKVSDSWPFRLEEIGDIGAEKIRMRVFLF